MSTEIAITEGAALQLAPPAPPMRPRGQVVAVAMIAAGSAMAIFALLGIYLAARHGAAVANSEWIPAGGLTLTGPNIALFTLLLSVPAMAWAQYAIGNDDRQNMWVALGLVLLLGVAFINAESFILTNLQLSPDPAKPIGIAESIPGMLIFTIIGAHIVMVGAAMVSILLTGLRTLGGQFTSRNREGISAVALYWYVTVAVFPVLWYAIYVTK